VNDACPDVFGLAALKGCPDTDKDGVADKDDNVLLLQDQRKCRLSFPDTDGDGVLDKDDKPRRLELK
jgi:hypothetical protein